MKYLAYEKNTNRVACMYDEETKTFYIYDGFDFKQYGVNEDPVVDQYSNGKVLLRENSFILNPRIPL